MILIRTYVVSLIGNSRLWIYETASRVFVIDYLRNLITIIWLMSCTKAYSLFKPVFKFVCLPFVRFMRVVWTKGQPRGYDANRATLDPLSSHLSNAVSTADQFSWNNFKKRRNIEVKNRNRTGFEECTIESGFCVKEKKVFFTARGWNLVQIVLRSNRTRFFFNL